MRVGRTLSRKASETEVVDGAAEEHRRDLAVLEALLVERVAGGFEELGLIAKLLAALFARAPARASGRRGRSTFTGALLEPAVALDGACSASKRYTAVLDAVIDAAERTAAEDRPRDREDADAEDALDLADQLERVAAGAVHLVHEREDGDLRCLQTRKSFLVCASTPFAQSRSITAPSTPCERASRCPR